MCETMHMVACHPVQVMGFRDHMQVAVDIKSSRQAVWQTVFTKADKSVTLVDLCGHEK